MNDFRLITPTKEYENKAFEYIQGQYNRLVTAERFFQFMSSLELWEGASLIRYQILR